MSGPLKRMNPRTVIADLFAALGQPLPSPMKRMSKRLVVELANEIIAEAGGEPLSRGSSFADTAAALWAVYDGLEGGGEEPGDDRPDWVPEGATHHVDLVRAFNDLDAAWTLADGVVAVDTLLGADANTENGWGTTAYDPAGLDEDGYNTQSPALGPPAFIGAALTKVLAGATVVWSTKGVSGDFEGGVFLAVLSEDGNSAIQVEKKAQGSVEGTSWEGPLDVEIANIVNRGVDGAINRIAVTYTGTRLDIAANGSDADTSAVDGSDAVSPLVAALIDVGNQLRLQYITLRDALPTTVGLSELSETGVTNTAPTSIAFDWQAEDDAEGHDASYGEAAFASASGGSPVAVALLSATDAEGNPLAWSLTDDDGGNYALDGATLQVADVLTVAEHSGTVRATDPGGLYVEQEFTITVTA